MEECARLCRDVADLTSLHAQFMTRNSESSAALAEACAEACEGVPKSAANTTPSTVRSVLMF